MLFRRFQNQQSNSYSTKKQDKPNNNQLKKNQTDYLLTIKVSNDYIFTITIIKFIFIVYLLSAYFKHTKLNKVKKNAKIFNFLQTFQHENVVV